MDVDGDIQRGDYRSSSIEEGHRQTDGNWERADCGLRIVNDRIQYFLHVVYGAVMPQCGEKGNYNY